MVKQKGSFTWKDRNRDVCPERFFLFEVDKFILVSEYFRKKGASDERKRFPSEVLFVSEEDLR
jgi:hypothetical protein